MAEISVPAAAAAWPDVLLEIALERGERARAAWSRSWPVAADGDRLEVEVRGLDSIDRAMASDRMEQAVLSRIVAARLGVERIELILVWLK